MQSTIHTRIRIQALKPTIEQEAVYEAMVGQGGATPAELFDKFVDGLRDKYVEDKRRLKDYLPRGVGVGHEWGYDDFVGSIEKALVGACVRACNVVVGRVGGCCQGGMIAHSHSLHARTNAKQRRTGRRRRRTGGCGSSGRCWRAGPSTSRPPTATCTRAPSRSECVRAMVVVVPACMLWSDRAPALSSSSAIADSPIH